MSVRSKGAPPVAQDSVSGSGVVRRRPPYGVGSVPSGVDVEGTNERRMDGLGTSGRVNRGRRTGLWGGNRTVGWVTGQTTHDCFESSEEVNQTDRDRTINGHLSYRHGRRV